MMGVMGKYRRVIAKATDQRIKVTNEVLQVRLKTAQARS